MVNEPDFSSQEEEIMEESPTKEQNNYSSTKNH